MKLSEIINPSSIINEFQAKDGEEAIFKLAEMLVKVHSLKLTPESVAGYLLNREKLGSTAIGNKIALPHARIPEINSIYSLLAISKNGVPFNSNDGKPVNLFFTIIGPEEQPGDLLKAIAAVSKVFRKKSVGNRILKLKNPDEIYSYLVEEEKRILSEE